MNKWWDSPIFALLVTGILGSLSVSNGRFEEFVVMALAFILAKQFEKHKGISDNSNRIGEHNEAVWDKYHKEREKHTEE